MGQQRPQSSLSGIFHPNHSRYHSCCCHVKTFTIGFGIVEIFIICFLLVAVVPDLNSSVCDNIDNNEAVEANEVFTTTAQPSLLLPPGNTVRLFTTTTTTNTMIQKNEGISTLRQISCKFSVLWLVWMIVQIIATFLMFYGIKNNKWPLFIPHIFLRACCAIIFVGLVVLFVIAFVNYLQAGSGVQGAILAFILIGLGILIFWVYVMKCQIRCCQFVKKSAETGFSISNTRPVGTHTLSMSEPVQRPPTALVPSAPPASATMNTSVPDGMGRVNSSEGRLPPINNTRELPPLRHTYRPCKTIS